MSHYYYFSASIPTLPFQGPPPFTDEDFLARCSHFLNQKDMAAVRSATLDGGAVSGDEGGSSQVLSAYRNYEVAVRNELARLRAQKLGRPADKYARPGASVTEAETAARAAFACESPLDAELSLERHRWEYTERLKAFHYFDGESLVAYRLQLLSLIRRQRFDPDRGGDAYASVYGAVLETANKNDSGVTA